MSQDVDQRVLEERRVRVASIDGSGAELSRALIELAAETCVRNNVGIVWEEGMTLREPGEFRAARWFSNALGRWCTLLGKKEQRI